MENLGSYIVEYDVKENIITDITEIEFFKIEIIKIMKFICFLVVPYMIIAICVGICMKQKENLKLKIILNFILISIIAILLYVFKDEVVKTIIGYMIVFVIMMCGILKKDKLAKTMILEYVVTLFPLFIAMIYLGNL